MNYILVSKATGVNYYVQFHSNGEFMLNGLLNNAMRFSSEVGALQMKKSLSFSADVEVMKVKSKKK